MNTEKQKVAGTLWNISQTTLSNSVAPVSCMDDCTIERNYAINVLGYWVPAKYIGFNSFALYPDEIELFSKWLGFTFNGGRYFTDSEVQKGRFVRKFKQVKKASPVTDAVNHPTHYNLFADGSLEVKEAIKKLLTPEEYAGYLKGNILKYRLRAGNKDDTLQDIAKAKKYNEFLANFFME